VSKRIKSALGEADIAARLGGDKFAIILNDNQEAAASTALAPASSKRWAGLANSMRMSLAEYSGSLASSFVSFFDTCGTFPAIRLTRRHRRTFHDQRRPYRTCP
jgi:GGDEF domain-containing protein